MFAALSLHRSFLRDRRSRLAGSADRFLTVILVRNRILIRRYYDLALRAAAEPLKQRRRLAGFSRVVPGHHLVDWLICPFPST
jgi:hypothetical protein